VALIGQSQEEEGIVAQEGENESEPNIYDDIEEADSLGRIQLFKKKGGQSKTEQNKATGGAIKKFLDQRKQRKEEKKQAKAGRSSEQKKGIINKVKDLITAKKSVLEKSIKENPSAEKEAAAQSETTTTNTGADSEKAGIFDSISSFAKANPMATIAIAAVGSYVLIPPVRNAVNGMLGIGSKSRPQQAVSGLKGLPPKRSKKKAVKVLKLS